MAHVRIHSPTVLRCVGLVLGALLAFALSCQGTAMADDDSSLGVVIEKVKALKAARATNREIAEFVTRVVDDRIRALDSPRRADPVFGAEVIPRRTDAPADVLTTAGALLKTPKEYDAWRSQNIESIPHTAVWAWENRVGQCQDKSFTSFHILTQAGITDTRLVNSGKDHVFVVVGLGADLHPDVVAKQDGKDAGTYADLPREAVGNPHFWPEDAVVVDPWQGKVLDPNEAYINPYIGDRGNKTPEDTTKLFLSKQNQSMQHLAWNGETKTWECKEPYVPDWKRGRCVMPSPNPDDPHLAYDVRTETWECYPKNKYRWDAVAKRCVPVESSALPGSAASTPPTSGMSPRFEEPTDGRGQRSQGLAVRSLLVSPGNIEVKPNQSVTFRATAVFEDGTTQDVTDLATWEPGPGNTYTAPGDLKLNQRIKVTARFSGVSGSAEVDALAPSWSPAISHADQTGLRAQPAPPDAYTWYAMCEKSDGTVAYGENPDPTRQRTMGGPFEGPRTARWWIDTNCPSWLCNPDDGKCAVGPRSGSAGGGSYALCKKESGEVVVTRDSSLIANHSRYSTMGGPFLMERDAFQWIDANCPGGRCTSDGACALAPAAAPTGTAGWSVFCNLGDGSVVTSQARSVSGHRQMAGPFLGEPDARLWIGQHCPSWRCDPSGGTCAAGPRAAPFGQGYYALCERATGSVVYGKEQNVARYISLAGPFLGGVDAEQWIAMNYPSWRCDPATGRAFGPPQTSMADVVSMFGQREQERSQSRLAPQAPPAAGGTPWSERFPAPPVNPQDPVREGTHQDAPGLHPGTAPPAPTNPTWGTTPRPPSPPATARPTTPSPVDNKRWYVWHNCDKTGWWCILNLTQTTDADLKKQKGKVTILAVHQSEGAALQATCAGMSNFHPGGEFAAGSLADIGGNRYCVRDFGYYSLSTKKFECRKPRNK